MDKFDVFIWGMFTGYVLATILPVVRAILRNALGPSACNNDCDQGRQCDCAKKE